MNKLWAKIYVPSYSNFGIAELPNLEDDRLGLEDINYFLKVRSVAMDWGTHGNLFDLRPRSNQR